MQNELRTFIVVVHELSRIAYRNHGSQFRARVKTVLPNYRE
jgi:predicted metal-dependent hydrolase